MQRNPQYEAGFIRAVDHEEPDDLVLEAERRARLRRRMLAGAVVLIVGGATAAFVAARGSDSAAKQLAQGRQLIAGNEHQAAIVELKRSLLADPDQPSARFLLGQELLALGDPQAAEIEFGKALALHDDPERTLPLLVASVADQQRYERVVALVDGAKLASPSANADLQALLGTAYFALGKEAKARAAWAAVTTFVPDHPGALLAEAKALAASGAPEEAATLLARIPATAPRQRDVQALRGDVALATGRPGDAATAYEAAIALDPGSVALRTALAQAYVDLGRFDDAQAAVDRVFAASPNHPKASYIAAEAAVGRKDFRAASEAIAQSIQALPRDGKAHLLAGTIAIETGRPADAESHLRAAMALMPKDSTARRMLAEMYVEQHDAARADEAIGPLFATAPDDPRVAEVMARIALSQGDAARAAKAYDQVDPTRADRVDASLRAAALKFAAGDRAGGLARLRAAAAADPSNADVDAALVGTWLQARQPKEATAAWNAMVRQHPALARTYEARATIDVAVGDRKAARRSLEKAVELDPRALSAVAALAQLDVDDHQVDEARARLRTFVAAHPDDFDATMRLVAIERAGDGRDDAIRALLEDARKADPRSARAAQALAADQLAHGDARQALRTADDGLAFAPGDVPLLATAGDAALAAGSAARAAAIFKALTTMDVTSVAYPTGLGAAWLAAGDPEAALAAFRTGVARRPDDVDLQRALVGRLLRAERTDEAARLVFEMTRLAPRSPALPELDADVKLARRQYREAVDGYRRAMELNPSAELVVRASDALAKARQSGAANALLATWLQGHPNDEAVRRFDAEIASRTGDHRRAGDDFRVLLRLRPNDADLRRRLAASEAQAAGPQAVSLPDGSTNAPTNAPTNAATSAATAPKDQPTALRNASMHTAPGP